jgi:aspartyl-tRNA(Asn)/glutamyl-tRNA(Gln) amidotransferase subunit B
MADYFEKCLKLMPPGVEMEKRAKLVANWLLSDFARLLNATNTEIKDAKVEPAHLVEMLDLIDNGTLSTKMAKEVFEEMFHSGKSASQVVKEKGLVQISGASELEAILDKVLVENAAAVADFKKGRETALKFLVGQVMKTTKGQANPQMVNELLRRKLVGS